MARRGPIEVVGLEHLRHQLGTFMPREAMAILRRTVTDVAGDMRKEMRRQAPKVTGTLRKAIKSRRNRGTRDRVEASVYITHGKGVKNDAWYWPFAEFGTKNQPAQPFITPVFERFRANSRSVFTGKFFRQLSKQLEKRAKRQKVAA